MTLPEALDRYRTQLAQQKGRVAELEQILTQAKTGTAQLEGAILALEELLREESPLVEQPTNGDARPDA